MTAFALAHPWMAFVLVVLLIMTIDSLQANVCRVIVKLRKGEKQ